jgi:hypothetical protein
MQITIRILYHKKGFYFSSHTKWPILQYFNIFSFDFTFGNYHCCGNWDIAPTGTATITLDPNFWKFHLIRASFTLGERVSLVKKCLDCLDWNKLFWCSECGHSMYVDVQHLIYWYIGSASVFVMPCFHSQHFKIQFIKLDEFMD